MQHTHIVGLNFIAWGLKQADMRFSLYFPVPLLEIKLHVYFNILMCFVMALLYDLIALNYELHQLPDFNREYC